MEQPWKFRAAASKDKENLGETVVVHYFLGYFLLFSFMLGPIFSEMLNSP